MVKVGLLCWVVIELMTAFSFRLNGNIMRFVENWSVIVPVNVYQICFSSKSPSRYLPFVVNSTTSHT